MTFSIFYDIRICDLFPFVLFKNFFSIQQQAVTWINLIKFDSIFIKYYLIEEPHV